VEFIDDDKQTLCEVDFGFVIVEHFTDGKPETVQDVAIEKANAELKDKIDRYIISGVIIEPIIYHRPVIKKLKNLNVQ
jgi:hypothetical protein